VVGTTYTLDDVALHNNTEDCWLSIDKKVFNATEASRMHPAMFNCGKDVSENYHKNHGEGVRDKMMKYYIGELRSGTGVTNVDVPFEKNETLKPYRELYVDEGSWNPRELMLVVEKDAEKLLAIDGTTHKAVGRVHDVGFQPHTSVYSSYGKYMYIISRDGWLTKIDLTTLEPIVSVLVGKNSRGTAITDNDKYVAIGNYEPGNLVILDAISMEILKTIPLTMEKDGKQIESRAGAVVEDGNRIILALKDGTSVWAIDTDQPGFPVTHKFSDIGEGKPALHDGFLTPDGSYYIVASQGSKTAWVLDLATMKPIAEVETGETPHTGPGAVWGKYIYVPALGEGLITVIDTTTWKPSKYIKTGGPGLFVRSYSKDPTYPYVWADTAFGDRKDEIYVIDARVNEIIKTITPVKGESSWHPEFTYDGKFVYVVSQSANEVEVYDAFTFEIVKRIKSDTPSAISNVGLRIEEPGL
jgi:DNA-binding beta-propeller fold protein YncE